MTKEEFSNVALSIPHQPGCYKYYDAGNELLYVGKAKDLRKRVSSYFNKTVDNYKTRKLVSLIHAIDFTVTGIADTSIPANDCIFFNPTITVISGDAATNPVTVTFKGIPDSLIIQKNDFTFRFENFENADFCVT